MSSDSSRIISGGSDMSKIHKVREKDVATSGGNLLKKGIYRIENDEMIIGESLPIFISNWDYHLTDLNVYKDGMIDCWRLVDLNGFKELLDQGWIQISVPEGSRINIHNLGNIDVVNANFWRDNESLISDVEDIIAKLNNLPTRLEKFRSDMEDFKRNPTSKSFSQVTKSLVAVPWHQLIYIEDELDEYKKFSNELIE